ncbi:chaperonin 60 beta [Actinidia rufa]|uniref:Chaperonin 60 beta n=1 Tax=Actinidia rufa TaxID=165716 RepID=A0A7J0EFI1_9ERIC|nr:chaperonin 60 beta [Actinidia rufa]
MAPSKLEQLRQLKADRTHRFSPCSQVYRVWLAISSYSHPRIMMEGLQSDPEAEWSSLGGETGLKACFLESRGIIEDALEVAIEPDYRFELAFQRRHQFDYIFPYFVPDSEKMAVEYDNFKRSTKNCCNQSKAPGFGSRKIEYLDDIAILSGGTAIRDEVGLSLDKTEKEVLGHAAKVVLTKDTTTLVSDSSTQESVNKRVAQIRNLLEQSAKLSGVVAVIQAAVEEEGIVVGGGCTFNTLCTPFMPRYVEGVLGLEGVCCSVGKLLGSIAKRSSISSTGHGLLATLLRLKAEAAFSAKDFLRAATFYAKVVGGNNNNRRKRRSVVNKSAFTVSGNLSTPSAAASLSKPSPEIWFNEGSAFNALQTLADLSLMMLATTIENGKLIFMKCPERQLPLADVAQIMDSAVNSLQPCSQNLLVYSEIQKCMEIIRNQILALVLNRTLDDVDICTIEIVELCTDARAYD